MMQATKEQQRRDRMREYDSTLSDARDAVSVMVLLVQAREARSRGVALEEAFGDTSVDGADEKLPAAVWVALRQGDVDTTMNALMRTARRHFVIAEHEELDAGYRLTTVEERLGLPDLDLLQAQLAAFLQIPPDVIAVIAAWGPDDPRTADEVDTLIAQRFGTGEFAAANDPPKGALAMSSSEFCALLNLTPQQRSVLTTLVRQSDITVAAG